MTHENPLSQSERALADHYKAQARGLRASLAESSPLRGPLAELEQALEAGFEDGLADRFEVLAGQAAQAQDPRRYLLQTDAGQALQQQAEARLAQQARLARHLADALQKTDPSKVDERVRQSAALREVLGEHLGLWSEAARRGEQPQGATPGQLLQMSLGALSSEPATSPPTTQAPAPSAQEAQKIDLARIAERARGVAQRAVGRGEVGELLREDAPPPDPAAVELWRGRVERAAATAPASEQKTWSDLDAQLAQAARRYGAAWVQQASARQDASLEAPQVDVSGLLGARAESLRAQAEGAQAEVKAELQRQHAALAAQAQGAPVGASEAAQLARTLAQEVEGAKAQDLQRALERSAGELRAMDRAPSPSGAPPTLAARGELERAAARVVESGAERPAGASLDLGEEMRRGAQEQQARQQAQWVQRLMSRRVVRPLASAHGYAASRVFAGPKVAMELAPPLEGKKARSGEGMLGQVEGRRDRTQPERPVDPRLALMSRSVARAIDGIVARSQGEQGGGAAPRMAAAMPGNIFADVSSPIMQRVYLPALARLSNLGVAARPRGEMRRDAADNARQLARPEAIFELLLGEAGHKLRQDHPDVAERLEANFKEIAQTLEDSGSEGISLLQRNASRFRETVESWLGAGQQAQNEPMELPHDSAPESQAKRVVGKHMGMLFDADDSARRVNAAELAEDYAHEIERRLRMEKVTVDQGLLGRVGAMIGKQGSGGSVEAFAGPTSQQIAQTMGARAFTSGNQMFLPQGAPDSLVAHEMVHAMENNPTGDPTQVQREEVVAYGIQRRFEQAGEQMTQAVERSFDRMELARDASQAPIKLPSEPGGNPGGAQPEQRSRFPSTNTDRANKELEFLEHLVDAVEDLMGRNASIEVERFGGNT